MPKRSIKDFEGSVSVNGDVTPITRQPIDKLDSTRWPEMSVNELTEQRIILSNRISAASAYGGNASVINQLQRGLATLDGLIRQRSQNDGDEMFLI